MKATINGVIVEGEPWEIAEVIKLCGGLKTQDTPFAPMPVYPVYPIWQPSPTDNTRQWWEGPFRVDCGGVSTSGAGDLHSGVTWTISNGGDETGTLAPTN